MFSLRREQGRLAELASVIRILAGSDREDGPWRPGPRVPAGRVGHGGRGHARARTNSERGARRRCASHCGLRRSPTSPTPARRSATRPAAELVYPELAPLAGTNVMVGHLVAYYGAADRYLGMLAATLGDWERAEEHFERALELNAHMDASTWLAHTQYEYGRMLLLRGTGRRDEARALLGEADQLAATIGMGALRKRIAKLGAPPAAPPGSARWAVGPGGADPAPGRARTEQSRDRRRALHQRTHRRQPRAQHPAQDRLRQPHRGGLLRAPARPCRRAGAELGSLTRCLCSSSSARSPISWS